MAAVARAGQPVQTSIWPYLREVVANARHTIDLQRANFLYWNIDAAQAGLGGDDRCGAGPHPCSPCSDLADALSHLFALLVLPCGTRPASSWSPRTHPAYQLLERNYSLAFVLEPFNGAAPSPAQLRTRRQTTSAL